MPGSRRYFQTSAQQIDPLSWFTGPYLPLSFAGLVLFIGTIMTIANWGISSNPQLQLAGLWLCVIAGLLIHMRTRPLRGPIGWGTGAVALAISIAGLVLSALDYAGTGFELTIWWGTAAPSVTLLSLAPYLPVRKVLVLGGASTVVTVLTSFLILYPANPQLGPVGTIVILAYAPLLSLAATTTFSYSVVSTMMRMLESPSRIVVAGQAVRDEAVAENERVALARLTARAAPFLEDIAAAGRITPGDRALAGQLARRLRDELVTQSNVSWLDSIASQSRLVVVDPDRLAQRMNNAQRTALRGLLGAILDLPETDAGSLMVELRTASDGATAVAVSLDMSLPEGTRIMHLAPYYLTLEMSVDDFTFDRDRLSFRITPDR
ncbi:MAG: hypothetical protein JWP85_56 [Rhodoglobus sp.]|nr:hypothetical protein [Rhodoglobus sp.]